MISKARFLFSIKEIIKQYEKIEKVSDVVCYSVKSNPFLCNVLEEKTKSSFLVHNVNELKHIIDNSKVWYMLHSVNEEEMEIVIGKEIRTFIVDNEKDLKFLLNYVFKKNIKINLLLRMRLREYSLYTGKYFVYGMYSEKINKEIRKLKDNKNIDKLGIHVHRKTQNLSEWSLIREIEETIDDDVLDIISYLDIGGGIPVQYKNVNIKDIEIIYSKIKELKKYLNEKNILLVIEPGRAIAAPSGQLETTIENIVDNTIFINSSVFNSAMDVIVSNVKYLVKGEVDENKGKPYVIKGLTPASEDIFRYKVFLKNPKIGDELIFLNAGAYIYYTTLFDLEKPEIVFGE